MILKKSRSDNSPRLFNIIEDLKDGFCTINTIGDFIYSNLAAKELIKLINKPKCNFFFDIIKDKKSIDHINNFLLKHEYIKDMEIDLYSDENLKFPALISISKIKDPGNKVIGMSVLIKDMTYIKQVQQQLLQAQKMESIGMLASGVAHEFNNILTGIIPNAELIKITSSPDDINYQRAESIQKSASRASEIVKKLLNFARNENLQKGDSTNFIKVVKDTLDILERLFDRKITFTFEFDKNLYNASIDDTSIQQIIMNLSINAKDAIKDSGKIDFKADNLIIGSDRKEINNNLKPGKYIKFQITDTGHGMDKIQMKYIFDPFYTTKEPGKGTGLGLSMVYGIIKACNGAITVESKVGIGTKFTVYLPATDKVPQKEVSEFVQQNIGKGRTILVIDDEEIIAEMACDMLNSIGFNVFTAKNGFEGLEIYKKNRDKIDLVLLDLLMPGMDGSTCFSNLKLINPMVNVVISTGMGEHKKKSDLLEMGVKGYLEKPYTMKGISRTLDEVLNKS